MIRLLFLDADGTLVGANNDAHPRAWDALERARRAGIRLALCTGRPGVRASLELARRVAPDGVHAFQTGAVISKPGEPALRTRLLPRPAFEALVALSRAEGRPLEAYGERRYFLERSDEITRAHGRVLDWEPEVVDLLAVDEPIVRAQWAVRDAEWPRLRALTEKIEGLGIHTGTGPWAPGIRFANLIHRQASKADALRWMPPTTACRSPRWRWPATPRTTSRRWRRPASASRWRTRRSSCGSGPASSPARSRTAGSPTRSTTCSRAEPAERGRRGRPALRFRAA